MRTSRVLGHPIGFWQNHAGAKEIAIVLWIFSGNEDSIVKYNEIFGNLFHSTKKFWCEFPEISWEERKRNFDVECIRVESDNSLFYSHGTFQ